MAVLKRNLCIIFLLPLLLACGSTEVTLPDKSKTPSFIPSPSPSSTSASTPFIKDLKYDELTEIEISSETNLIASPAFVNSRVENAVINPGAKVYLVGSDEDFAWLLVLYKNTLGWIPSILSTIGAGGFDPVVISHPRLSDCSLFIGSIMIPNGDWESNINTRIVIQGLIYAKPEQANAEGTALIFEVEETGQEYPAEISYVPLDSGGQVLQYIAFIDDIRPGNHIGYKLNGLDPQVTPFQAVITASDCYDQSGSVQPNQTVQPVFSPNSPLPTLVIKITSSVLPPLYFSDCSGVSTTKFLINDLVGVTPNGQGLRLRSSPEVKDNNIKIKLSAGTWIKIFDGPVCSDGLVFWWVKVKSTGAFGWIAEGDSSGDFIKLLNRP